MWTWPWQGDLDNLERTIMATLDETLTTITTQLGKAKDEIVALIDQLKAEVAADAVQPATLDALTAAAQALDDVVPDVVPPPAE